MRNVARVLAGLIALLFLFFGVRYMFAPAGLLETAGLVATSEFGLATVRALIGGSFLTFGILIIMHVVLHQNHGVLRMTILFLLLVSTNFSRLCFLLNIPGFEAENNPISS